MKAENYRDMGSQKGEEEDSLAKYLEMTFKVNVNKE